MTGESRPYGLWPSPITPERMSEALRLLEAEWSADGRWLVWLEEYSGNGVLWATEQSGDAPRQIASGRSVRARVGYGGGSFAVGASVVVFVADDGRLYRQPLEGGDARPITPPGVLCASPVVSPDGQWVVYVYEVDGENGLAVVTLTGGQWPQKIAWGHDFYMAPTWHPDSRALAWVAWNHPQMPWDGTELYLQAFDGDGTGHRPASPQRLAGGAAESVLQPQFSPDGKSLAYLSDREGWYRIYLGDPARPDLPHRCLTPEDSDYAGPAWQLGMRWYAWLPDGQALVGLRNEESGNALVRVAVAASGAAPYPGVEGTYTDFFRPAVNPVNGQVAVFAAGDRTPARLVVLRGPEPKGESTTGHRIIRRSTSEQIPGERLSELREVSWHSSDGEVVYGLFAAPAPEVFRGDGRPPLVVSVHGGPTSQALRTWRPDVQFFTSRGYAHLDVNHRGSTGHGRRYRELLHELWGVADVADVISGARYVTGQGWADSARIAIRGGSAGGYTVLRALTTEPGLFRAGICLYGISELLSLVRETHKFEARYLDTLIGPLPRFSERYRERSPIHRVDRITAPLLILQGSEDKVVPPAQAEAIVASLRARDVPHVYHLYPGEGHGFRKKDTLQALWSTIEHFLQNNLIYV